MKPTATPIAVYNANLKEYCIVFFQNISLQYCKRSLASGVYCP